MESARRQRQEEHSLRARQSAHVPGGYLQRVQQQLDPHDDRHGWDLARSGHGHHAGPLPPARVSVQVVVMRTPRTRHRNLSLWVLVLVFAGTSASAAQEANVGPGKVEIGGFPMGGIFFGGGDGNKEVDFNVYSAGANLTYSFAERVAVEGEV